ncbi:tRNA pseudouridine(38-40) synthase TruA [Alteribacter populi]|uniref:tRNA pseudouridine(38-40) synthase TruA n=1 Tax=Alteribacter populi TaxID=2011011 RepID=UPI000BBB603C|nr:tRNA pseudouridine(38-40) synthase TruA [Alteribacter populi]
MSRFVCKIAYDGTNFSGYQVQLNGRTVQGELEKALKKLHKGKAVGIIGSGRTDANVHAESQVIHFDSELAMAPEQWQRALNAILPKEIAVLEVARAWNGFHARYDAVGKEYRYRILQSRNRDVFRRNYTYQPFPMTTKVEAMQQAAAYLLGTHDFTSFCSPRTDVEDKVRTIYSIDIRDVGDEIVFTFNGSGFLYQMVRIMTGTLMEIGQGKREVEEIQRILEAKDRFKAGHTAAGQGLCLMRVDYEPSPFSTQRNEENEG